MQMLVSLLLSIVLGYRAKQKGRDGLKFGAGVAVALLVPLTALQAWDQVAGVYPALGWVVTAFITCLAWMRLEKPKAGVDAKPAAVEQQGPSQKVQPGPAAPAPAEKVKETWREKLAGVIGIIMMVGAMAQGAKWLFGSRSDEQPQLATAATPTSASPSPSTSPGQTPNFELDKDGDPIINFVTGQPVWTCVNLKTGAHWRTIQFRSDGVYLYRGEANGWGLYQWESQDRLRMTADEADMWVHWAASERTSSLLQIANTYGLQVRCKLSPS
ncbi:MAG: hypothetical protein IV097_00435 [Burkholderiaceae bacterium]|nr:hypothetical protein [Burkholderiaceae bacterium]